jgi:hypothetical protein
MGLGFLWFASSQTPEPFIVALRPGLFVVEIDSELSGIGGGLGHQPSNISE